MVTIGPRFFETVGANSLRGRDFTLGDGEPGRGAAIVNQRFAALHFAGGDALGQRIRLAAPPFPGAMPIPAGDGEWMTIVGVTPNVQHRPPPEGGFAPVVYVPYAANVSSNTNIMVRFSGDPAPAADAVRAHLRALDPDLPLYDVRTVDDVAYVQRWDQRVFGSMFAIFAAIALVMAAVGLYAVTAYSVSQRTREFGVHMALGASASHVQWLVARRASPQVVIGLVLGIAGTVAVTRIIPAILTILAGGRSTDSRRRLRRPRGVAAAACLGPAQARHAYRPRAGAPGRLMGLQDVRLAVRLWWRNPWFAALAAVGLGLGIGVNNTFFALTNAAVIRGLPIEQADRVMFVGSLDAQDRVRGLSRDDVRSLREQTTTMAGVAAFSNARLTLTEQALPADAVMAASISHDGLPLLGRQPARGRAFSAADDSPGAPLVTILSDRLWERRYGRDPGIVGRAIALDGRPAVVIGVMEPGFQFPGATDLWVPLGAQLAVPAPSTTARTLSVFGRLRDGASRATAQAELRTLASQWNAAAPAGAAPLRTTVVPINEQMVGRVTDLVWLTFLTVGALVLLIACANVANLLLMRGAERSHELAIRTGLGASRARLVRQLLVEGLVLAVAGGTIGLGLSLLGLQALSLAVPADVPFLADLRLDGRVMAVLLLTSLGSVVLFGLAPALHLSNVGPNDVLASGGRTATRTRRRWWIATFLAVEFALTLVLACSVVLGMRFNQAARAAQYQFDTSPALHGVDRLEPGGLRDAGIPQRLLRSRRGGPSHADRRRGGEHRQRHSRRRRSPACGDDRRARPGARKRPRGHDGRRRRRVLPHAGRAAASWPRHFCRPEAERSRRTPSSTSGSSICTSLARSRSGG